MARAKGPPSEAGSYSKALEGLADAAYIRCAAYRYQIRAASREGVRVELVAFADRVTRRFRKLAVPMYPAAFLFGTQLELLHGVKGPSLSAREWDLVGHVGLEVAGQMGLDVVWGGVASPTSWELRG